MCLWSAGGLLERVDRAGNLVPALFELRERPLMPRGVARTCRGSAGPRLDLHDGFLPQLERQVVALPRLPERGQRLGQPAQLVPHDPEIKGALALAEIDR